MASLNVAMVCLGNICRSPMAAAVLANKAEKISEVRINVSSSGTSGWNVGQGPHPTSKLVWEKAGYLHSHEDLLNKMSILVVKFYIILRKIRLLEYVLKVRFSGIRTCSYWVANRGVLSSLRT